MPAGLMGLCLAGLLAAIMSTVDAGLCACGSLLTYDFLARIRKRATDQSLVHGGRWIMIVIMTICILIAPQIRHFEHLFDYLVNVWALLAPPVFVCVVFGLFYQRATARAAFATLLTGCVLGAAAFAVLNFPILAGAKSALPLYLQNKLNVGFVITLICAAVILIVSHTSPHGAEDKEKAACVRRSREAPPMTAEESRRYHRMLAALIAVWVAVVVFLSPLGIGR